MYNFYIKDNVFYLYFTFLFDLNNSFNYVFFVVNYFHILELGPLYLPNNFSPCFMYLNNGINIPTSICNILIYIYLNKIYKSINIL